MNNLSPIVCWIQHGLCAEGNNFFELIGPILIFGIYIIASIVKAVAQKGKSGESGEEKESELKKAVRRRYQEIYQRQTGKIEKKRSEQQKTRCIVQPATEPESDSRTAYDAKWQRQQEKRRQREARIQERHPMVQQQRRCPEPKISPVASTAPVWVPNKTKLRTIKSTDVKPVKRDTILLEMLNEPENLRTAFVLKEILDEPVGLRGIF